MLHEITDGLGLRNSRRTSPHRRLLNRAGTYAKILAIAISKTQIVSCLVADITDTTLSHLWRNHPHNCPASKNRDAPIIFLFHLKYDSFFC